jgi:hypothetical protein
MRAPDRPWAETNADGIHRSDRLADRLTRLPAAHPSADLTAHPDWDDHDPDALDRDEDALDDMDPTDAEPGRTGRYDQPPDDLDSGPVDPGDEDGQAPADRFRPRRGLESAALDGLAGQDRSPYRPWFSGDGASDPWFAESSHWADP